jgi:hypothetical protein
MSSKRSSRTGASASPTATPVRAEPPYAAPGPASTT